MSVFQCPDCDGATLKIQRIMELSSDSRSDEIDLQLLRCDQCGLKIAAFYEESRRGSADSVDHYGHRVSEEWYSKLKQQIEDCPQPRNRQCNCATHRDWCEKDNQGRLRLFQGMDRVNTFPLDLAPKRKSQQSVPLSPPPVTARVTTTTVGGNLLTLSEIDLLGISWPPARVDGPAFQADENGFVNLDEALMQSRRTLAFWQREHAAAEGLTRDTLDDKIERLCNAIKVMERLIARLED